MAEVVLRGLVRPCAERLGLAVGVGRGGVAQ